MTAATSGRSTTCELLTALMGVESWFRETDGRATRLMIIPAGTAVPGRGRQRLVALVSERLHDWPDDEIERFAATGFSTT